MKKSESRKRQTVFRRRHSLPRKKAISQQKRIYHKKKNKILTKQGREEEEQTWSNTRIFVLEEKNLSGNDESASLAVSLTLSLSLVFAQKINRAFNWFEFNVNPFFFLCVCPTFDVLVVLKRTRMKKTCYQQKRILWKRATNADVERNVCFFTLIWLRRIIFLPLIWGFLTLRAETTLLMTITMI